MDDQTFDAAVKRFARVSRRGVAVGLLAAAVPGTGAAKRRRGVAPAADGTYCRLASGGWFCWGAPVVIPITEIYLRTEVVWTGTLCKREQAKYYCSVCRTAFAKCEEQETQAVRTHCTRLVESSEVIANKHCNQ